MDPEIAPNIARLAGENESAENFYGEARPSEANYLALLGGDTFGIHDDDAFYCTPRIGGRALRSRMRGRQSLPSDLVERLAGNGPSALDREWLIGYWPTECLAAIDEWIAVGGLTFESWIAHAGARRVVDPCGVANIYRRADLVVLCATSVTPHERL